MDIETAARLLEYRKKNGYSQEELAEKIGVSRQAISKWERSESSPDTDNLIALSKLYNISIDELINGKKENEKAKEIKEAPEKTVSAEEKPEEKKETHTARNAVISIIGLFVFLLTGFLFKWWAFCWTFLLLTICVISLVEAIERKNPSHFAYPLLVVAVYCIAGIAGHIWHPTWILFITIPFYYMVCDLFKKKDKKD